MRRIVNSTFSSLDGVTENPHLWPAPGRSSGGRGGPDQADLLLPSL